VGAIGIKIESMDATPLHLELIAHTKQYKILPRAEQIMVVTLNLPHLLMKELLEHQ
jgi:hypothetical protein